MRQETQTRKKYAAGRIPRALTQPPATSEGATIADLMSQMQALAKQVARLQRTTKRIRRRPRVRSAEATETMTPEEWAADQERRRAILVGLIARAQALVPDPPDSPTRKACRESPIDEIIVEKFRRQGFNL